MIKFKQWLNDFFFWKKQMKNIHRHPSLNDIDATSLLLANTVRETSEASKKLIKKLERLEEELEDREELLDVMFHTIPDFLLLKDGIGRWKILNKYGKKLYGIEGKNYKNKTDLEIAELYPKFASNLEQCSRTDEEAWRNGKATEFEEISVDTDGNEYIFDVVKTPIFNEDGTRKYLLVHGKNVTEEVKSTKHINMLVKALNHASDCIVITDHDHNIVYANDAMCSTYEYTLQELMGKPMKIIASGKTHPMLYQTMYRAISNGEAWTGVMVNKTKSGNIIPEVVTITPILNGKPYPIYYIGVKRLLERRKHIRTKDNQ